MNTQTPINQIRGQYLHLLIEECREIIKKAPTTPQKYFIEKEEEKEPFFNLGLALKMFLSQFEDIISVEEIAEKMDRSEEHTSELQSRFELVCRLLLAKKK